MRKEIVTAYAPSIDNTYVMEYTYDEAGEIRRMECVGWYCGTPCEELTLSRSNGGDDLVAIL